MASIIIFSLSLASLSLASPTSRAGFTCPAGVNWETKTDFNAYADPFDPYSYYLCGPGGAVHYNCPSDTIFDAELHLCDWDVKHTDTLHPMATAPAATSTSSANGEGNGPTSCPACPADWEKREYNTYRVEGNCAAYCICGPDGASQFTCPKGTLFSDVVHFCDWETNVICPNKA
eukprot:comp21175_c0_seq1/m.28708 comp21175_c0_seq1/g.28708  ORF comp21175_c0_seq1/g.28708 comp21175_c0_seq1/m.28708 type:complete len:175 (-) comp21175_c0_seq1:516-1040(-)